MAQGKGKGKGVSGAGGTSSSGSSSGSSSSGGNRVHKTAGSTSTSTPANNQSTVAVSTPNYAAALGYSTNSVTQGAGAASNVSASNVQQSQQTTGQANVTTLGVKPAVNPNPVGYGNQEYVAMVAKYGKETADKLATQTYMTTQEYRTKYPATNTDNQYLQNENAAITNAEKRQAEFVNNNSFMANPQPRATAPIPNVITVSTPLYQQAGERENPLQILEGNRFVSPSQQFLPQVNDSVAPRPEYTSFTNNPYIGVHQNSAISPNANESESQRKSPMDWLDDIRNHKYFGFAIVGIIGLIVLSMFGGAKMRKGSGSGGGISRGRGGSITVIN